MTLKEEQILFVPNRGYKTKNYDLFSYATDNREIKPLNVNKLKLQLEERGAMLSPIIVDSNFIVIDGQHRLEAARELNMEAYFLINPELLQSDTRELNSVANAWKQKDFIKYEISQSNSNYEMLDSVMRRFDLGVTSAMFLLNGVKAQSQKFKKGLFKVTQYDKTNVIAPKLQRLIEAGATTFRSDKTIGEILPYLESTEFDYEYLLAKVTRMPTVFQRVYTTGRDFKIDLKLVMTEGRIQQNKDRFLTIHNRIAR